MKNQARGVLIYSIIITFFLLSVYYGSHTVTVMAENTPVTWEHCIIIDPGHGGVDGGATSYSGRLESAYNLEISLKLMDLLHFLGYNVKIIRTEDVSVYTKGETIAQKKVSDLKERVRIANSTENALLLSIHQNTYPDSRYSGAQVFYAGTAGSKELAQQLQAAFLTELTPGSNRRCTQSEGIYLMEHIQCPGVLIECGFLSNPQEDTLLQSNSYQKKLSCVIAGTVSQYLSNT